jgi:DNA-binding response OmpR family regulator
MALMTYALFAADVAEHSMEAIHPTHAPRTVLIVDDEPSIADVLAELLSEEGYQTQIAIGGDHALSMLATGRPDLMLLDLYMPGMSGIEVLASLRANDAFVALPVLMMTAGSIDRDDLTGQGATAVISKPFEMDTLLETVRTTLR